MVLISKKQAYLALSRCSSFVLAIEKMIVGGGVVRHQRFENLAMEILCKERILL